VLSLDVLAVLAAFVWASAALVTLVVLLTSDRRIQPRHAARRPPVGGARVAGPDAAPTLADLPRVEPPITDSLLVRPYVSRHLAAVPASAPMTLPAQRTVAVRHLHRCPTCRDGQSVGALAVCVWCGCPRGGWSA
jgi:hypothetical protein